MSKTITFHDHHPQIQSLKSAVIAGLSKPNKSIPPKYFYDERGSKLFAEICEQPEYYPNIERALLSKITEEIFHLTGTDRLIIEPGAGSATKIRILLDPLKPSAYLPMDISCEYLRSSAAEIADDFPWLPVHAVCVDFTHSILCRILHQKVIEWPFSPAPASVTSRHMKRALFSKWCDKHSALVGCC